MLAGLHIQGGEAVMQGEMAQACQMRWSTAKEKELGNRAGWSRGSCSRAVQRSGWQSKGAIKRRR